MYFGQKSVKNTIFGENPSLDPRNFVFFDKIAKMAKKALSRPPEMAKTAILTKKMAIFGHFLVSKWLKMAIFVKRTGPSALKSAILQKMHFVSPVCTKSHQF